MTMLTVKEIEDTLARCDELNAEGQWKKAGAMRGALYQRTLKAIAEGHFGDTPVRLCQAVLRHEPKSKQEIQHDPDNPDT